MVHNDFLTPDAVVLFCKVVFVDDLRFEEAGVTSFVDLHLAHHLTHDNFKVLVVDFYTLQTINVLHLVDDVFLNGGRTLDGKDVARSDATIGERRTSANVVVLLYQDLLGERHEILLDFTELRSHDDFTITALDATHGDFTINFRNDSGVGWIACLEELSHTRQTTGDVTSRTDNTRNLDDDVTSLEHLLVFDSQVTVDGEVVSAERFATFVDDVRSRHYTTFLRFGDDAFAETSSFVFFDTIGDTFAHVFEDNATSHFGNDNGVEGVPLSHHSSLRDALTIVDEEL